MGEQGNHIDSFRKIRYTMNFREITRSRYGVQYYELRLIFLYENFTCVALANELLFYLVQTCILPKLDKYG